MLFLGNALKVRSFLAADFAFDVFICFLTLNAGYGQSVSWAGLFLVVILKVMGGKIFSRVI